MSKERFFVQKFNRKYRLICLAKNGKISSKNYVELTLEEKALLVSRKYGEMVSFFVKRLKEVKPNFHFSNLEKNIKTLKIKDKLFLKDFADYQSFENRILLNSKHKFNKYLS